MNTIILINIETLAERLSVSTSWVQKNFKGEGKAVGGWAPFKAGGRWRKGFGLDTSAKLLQDTGALRASFLPFASKTDAGIGSLGC